MSSDEETTSRTTSVEAPSDVAKPRRHRPRRIIAAVLAVLAALMSTIAVTGVWLKRTTFDTDRWVATVGPIADDPQVQTALAAWATDQISQVVDVKALLESALPKRGQVLAGPLSNAVDGFVMQQVNAFFASKEFPQLWKNANATLHEHVLAVLKGNGKAFKTQDGKVVIDLIPVLVEVLQRIDQRTNGLLAQHLPALNEDLTPDQVRAKISTALGRPIPADFGTIEVFDARQLTAVQRAVQWFQEGVVAFVVLAVLLIGAAVLVAPDRRRIAIWLGLGAAVTFVTFRALGRAIGKQILSGIVLPRNQTAAQDIVHQVFSSYRTLTAICIALGLVVAATAFLAGPSRAAVATREQFTRASWLSDHRGVAEVGILLVAAAVVLFADLTFAGIGLILVVVAILELVLWRLPSGPAAPPTVEPI